MLAKTHKGQEEIETRSHKLPGRLRAVLIMVDGQRTGAELLDQAGALAEQLAAQLNDLITLGFIEEVRGTGYAGPAVEPQTLASSSAAEATAAPIVETTQPEPVATAAAKQTGPNWTAVPLDVLKARLAKMLNDSLGMRAMFLTAQLSGVKSHRDLEITVNEMAQSLATTMGADAAQNWRLEARAVLGLPSR
ncbi:MAG: hypothetical protein JNM76_14920 [Betaproteobacteria bacterium]|nr:hypothetical protein [Betaproteobacteria bacterium]